ncbi:MAG: hypothetical protein AB1461_01155 [Thermodesulfobacteriota bacterium]
MPRIKIFTAKNVQQYGFTDREIDGLNAEWEQKAAGLGLEEHFPEYWQEAKRHLDEKLAGRVVERAKESGHRQQEGEAVELPSLDVSLDDFDLGGEEEIPAVDLADEEIEVEFLAEDLALLEPIAVDELELEAPAAVAEQELAEQETVQEQAPAAEEVAAETEPAAAAKLEIVEEEAAQEQAAAVEEWAVEEEPAEELPAAAVEPEIVAEEAIQEQAAAVAEVSVEKEAAEEPAAAAEPEPAGEEAAPELVPAPEEPAEEAAPLAEQKKGSFLGKIMAGLKKIFHG